MKTVNAVGNTVAFYAASPRITQDYRIAVKIDKSLASRVKMHELERIDSSHRVPKNPFSMGMVVFSHADDGPIKIVGARAESVFAGAFHLLFTGPATHPDRIAQWMRTTNIRSEDRLHVVKVDASDTAQVAQLLGRVCSALETNGHRGGIIDAYIAGDELLVRGPKYRMLHVPLAKIDVLNRLPDRTLLNFVIDPDGSFLHWPDPVVHLGWNQFLQAVDPAEFRKAQQRSDGFNKRYGKTIRTVREAAGIPQSKIVGLTDRQLRRIESGECRATTAALAALAQAHGFETNLYLEQLAQATAH